MDSMMRWLPYYYKKSKLANEVFDVIRHGADKVKSDIAEKDRDLFITTTDSFDLHEKDVGITPNADTDAETRRANVIAKLRGSNVLTVDELKRLVSVYEPTSIEVIENYSEYTVILDFAYREGQPKNINEILAAIEEVKPAHIRIGTNYVRNPTGDIHMGCLLEKHSTVPLMALDISRSMNPRGSPILGGAVHKQKTAELVTVDFKVKESAGTVMLSCPLIKYGTRSFMPLNTDSNKVSNDTMAVSGVIQTEKTIDLEVSNG